MPPPGPSPALFIDTINAYQRTEALRAAIELDLFTQVAAGRRTPEQLAQACQASPRGVRILADYLTILGLLRKDGDSYQLTPDAGTYGFSGSAAPPPPPPAPPPVAPLWRTTSVPSVPLQAPTSRHSSTKRTDLERERGLTRSAVYPEPAT